MEEELKNKLGNFVHRVVVEARGDPSHIDRLVRTHAIRLNIKDPEVKRVFEAEAKSRARTEVEREKKHRKNDH